MSVAEDKIVAGIISDLERGVAPWQKSWEMLGCQRNAADGRSYQGHNALWLAHVQAEKGYATPLWVTFEGAKKMGGYVKKGASGTAVTWMSCRTVKETNKAGKEVERKAWAAGAWIVFNVAQTTIPEEKLTNKLPELKTDNVRDADLEAFAFSAGISIVHGGDRAFYSPTSDTIHMPRLEQFETSANYYSTLLHELAHATGHASRLGRKLAGRADTTSYAEEELVAELTSAFLGAEFQLDGELRHSSYLASWLAAIKADNRLLFRAAATARKAATWLREAAETAPKQQAA